MDSDSETSLRFAARSSSGKKRRNRHNTKHSGIKSKSADTVKAPLNTFYKNIISKSS
jgi:hypothetical protein